MQEDSDASMPLSCAEAAEEVEEALEDDVSVVDEEEANSTSPPCSQRCATTLELVASDRQPCSTFYVVPRNMQKQSSFVYAKQNLDSHTRSAMCAHCPCWGHVAA